jgi:hypothetical protein
MTLCKRCKSSRVIFVRLDSFDYVDVYWFRCLDCGAIFYDKKYKKWDCLR